MSTVTTERTPPTTPSTTPSTQTSAPAPTPPHQPAFHLAFFRTPSSNIGCALAAGQARCDIRKRDWTPPPRPANCPSEVDSGQGLQVGRSARAGVVCAGDTTLNASGPVLRYGQDSRVGGFTCASRTAGVTCRNERSGHGFFIARARFRTF